MDILDTNIFGTNPNDKKYNLSKLHNTPEDDSLQNYDIQFNKQNIKTIDKQIDKQSDTQIDKHSNKKQKNIDNFSVKSSCSIT